MQPQIVRINLLLARKRDSTLQNVLQLANVSREIVRFEFLKRLLRKTSKVGTALARQPLKHRFRNYLYILGTFAERWHFEFNDVQSVIQISAKPSSFDKCGKILVSCANYPYINRILLSCTDFPYSF